MENNDAINRHLEYLVLRRLSPATIYQRRRHLLRLAHFVDPHGLLDVTEDDLDRWQQSPALTAYTPVSKCAALAHTAEFYKWAQREELIVRMPTRRLIRPKVPRGLPRPISEEDLALAIQTASDRIRPWLTLAAYAGLRALEIANLRRDDVLDNAVPPVLIIHGKGDKTRVVPIGPHLLLELQAAGLPTRGYVFRRLDGKAGPNAPWVVSQQCNRHLHGLGIDSTLHKLRHRFGTRTYQITQDIRVVQELMGHENPATTAGYAAYSKQGAVRAVLALDEALNHPLLRGQPSLPFMPSDPA